MNAGEYPPLNVLCINWFEKKTEYKGHIQPIRIEQESGEVHHVKKVRHHSFHRQGITIQHQFVVSTKEGDYLELFLDTKTLTWRLTQMQTNDGVWKKFHSPMKRI